MMADNGAYEMMTDNARLRNGVGYKIPLLVLDSVSYVTYITCGSISMAPRMRSSYWVWNFTL